MANNDMSFCQRAVMEFLVKEEIPAAEIHQRLQCAYGSVCMGVSSVQRWVKRFKDGNTSIKDEPRSGCPRTASTEHNEERVDEIIQDDRHVTVDTIVMKVGFTISSLKRNGRVWNGIICILHQKRRQRQCHQLRRFLLFPDLQCPEIIQDIKQLMSFLVPQIFRCLEIQKGVLGNKKREYLKDKIDEFAMNSKNKNIIDLYRGINDFKRGYQPSSNLVKDENDLLADSHNILNRWKNCFSQFLNVPKDVTPKRDEPSGELCPQNSHRSSGCVGRGTILLEPDIS
ncbi:hypothetical protein B7P43_G11022 [Cryptotermes secundus]|uniref:Mos1 transposase HTH domain-containing protein n=1 Tax=Cryptotermes secundus TaxID=105785 RepID=A0A2J7PHF1_9NEOP|nr:hypothetical protein B7P43_G11022 [Cryptotermes secundus]